MKWNAIGAKEMKGMEGGERKAKGVERRAMGEEATEQRNGMTRKENEGKVTEINEETENQMKGSERK